MAIKWVGEEGLRFKVPIPEDTSGVKGVAFYTKDAAFPDGGWVRWDSVSVAPEDKHAFCTINISQNGVWDVAAKAVDNAGNESVDFLVCETQIGVDTVPPILTDISVEV